MTSNLEAQSKLELRENSWRYLNGENIIGNDSNSIPSPLSVYTPWTLTDNGYINNRGETISGAVNKGINVSEHNGEIDWASAKADGIDFAIIRCGYGSDYTDQDDDSWEYNISECERLDIPYGVYLYSYANNIEMARNEAAHTLRLLEGHTPKYPVYLDLEENSLASTENRELLASMAEAYCTTISNAGYEAGVYANLNWWTNYLTDPIFDTWKRWVAQYTISATTRAVTASGKAPHQVSLTASKEMSISTSN